MTTFAEHRPFRLERITVHTPEGSRKVKYGGRIMGNVRLQDTTTLEWVYYPDHAVTWSR